MMQSEGIITRENAFDIIKKFAREYRKELGKVPGEIIFVGGGSIMLNYKFRDATQDFDVILKTVSGVKDVIAKFADDNNLPRDWMNSDFTKTASYSSELSEVSKHFCTLNNGTLEIRTVIENGKGVNYGIQSQQVRYPRTAVGMVGPGEYYLITAGESAYNGGMTYDEVRDVLLEKGCTFGKCMDGGGSSSLIFFYGEVINTPAQDGVERAVSDFLYFTEG